MSQALIPGLTFAAADDDIDESIEIPSFLGTIKVPESRRYGISRRRKEFETLGTIYEGTFRHIYKCRDKLNGKVYALKKFIYTPEVMQAGFPVSFLREINILNLKHENIVNSYGPVVGKKLLESNYLLLDYCITSLQELIEKKCVPIYEEDVVKYMTKQLFKGINFMHESTIIHRNISCGNILFTESGILKISGFHSARYCSKENMTPAKTEMTYRAPELLFRANSYGLPADIWAIGCIFAKLLLKKPLFTGDSELAVLKSIFSVLGVPSEEIWPGFEALLNIGNIERRIIHNDSSSDLKNICTGVPDLSYELLQDLLICYPTARLTAAEVLSSSYIVNAPDECSSEKMASILQTALSSYHLLEVPMEV